MQITTNSDKKGNGKRFPNFQRDAHFFSAFRAVREAAAMAVSPTSSVTAPSFPSTPSSPSESTSSALSLFPVAFERFIASKTTARELQMIASRSPAQWRDLTPWMQMLYRHFAADQLGILYSFSLNLDAEIEAGASTLR